MLLSLFLKLSLNHSIKIFSGISNDYTEAEILAMPFWERLAQELDELDRQAHEILQKEFPDDEDIPGLALTDITKVQF